MLSFSQLSKSYVFQRDYCHTKVNEIGQQSRLNLTSVMQEKHSQTLSLPKISGSYIQNQKKKQKLLAKRSLKSRIKIYTNPEFDELETQKIQKSQTLGKKIKELKEMQLLNKNRIQFTRYENETKRSSIMNDFHSPKTNGGYSRSKTGGIYYK